MKKPKAKKLSKRAALQRKDEHRQIYHAINALIEASFVANTSAVGIRDALLDLPGKSKLIDYAYEFQQIARKFFSQTSAINGAAVELMRRLERDHKQFA